MIWKFLKQNVLFPKGLNWVQHRVSRIGLFLSRLSELVWKLEGEISLQLELKRLPSLGPPAKGNERKAKKSRFCPNWTPVNGNTLSLICNSEKFRVVSNSAKRDANGFFKVLWLSLHLLNSRHSVRKSKFGTCAVTVYCSFNLLITLNINIYCDIYIWYIPIRKVNWMLRCFVPFSYLDDKAIFKNTYTITTNNRVLNYLAFS